MSKTFKYKDTIEAAEADDFEEIVKMYEAGFDLWRDYENNVCKIAAKKGNLDMLIYCYDQDDFIFDQELPRICARYNNVDCLNFCRDIDIGFCDHITTIAAENGAMDCLKYLIEKGYSLSIYTAMSAVRNGHLHVLKYLIENRVPIYENTIMIFCKISAMYGYIDCFEYCYSLLSTEDKNNFWKKEYYLSRMLPLINFDKPIWREILTTPTNINDSIINEIANKDLVELINNKRKEMEKTVEIIDSQIGTKISTDVVKYCIQKYI